MDTTPTPRSHRDRRITPRRDVDIRLHYATVNALAAAVALFDPELPGDQADGCYEALESAVEQYVIADAAAHG